MPFSDFPEFQITPASNDDLDHIIRLIDDCYQEYGDRVVLNGDDKDLLDIEANYKQQGGEFIVVRDPDGVLVGTHAVSPISSQDKLCTFRRLYLASELRGSGLGQALMLWAIQWAREAGYQRVEFWSDTRFTRAHRFFENLGFQTAHETRDMDDGIQPYSEFFFWLDILPDS